MATPIDKLLSDLNDDVLLHDVADELLLYDVNDPPEGLPDAPPLEGLIDAVGGQLGGPIGERVYLVETLVEATGDSTASVHWKTISNHPISGDPFEEPIEFEVDPFVFRLANLDYTSARDDDGAPSTFWDGRLIDPGTLDMALPLNPVGDALNESAIGQVVVDNTDAEYDTVLDDNRVLSQTIVIRAGRRGLDTSDFLTVARARLTAIGISEAELTLDLEDPTRYTQNLFPTTVYTGLGGEGGPAELEGVVRPIVLGRVWNMSPVLIDAVELIYQAHDGAVAAITGVFDGGVPLAFASNVASYGALAALDVDPGDYATCRSTGHIKIGGSPAFEVTAHVDGAAAAGTTIRSIATYLALQLEAVIGLDIDVESFEALPETRAGWLWANEFTFVEAISRFVGDAGYHWGSTTSGTIATDRLTAPNPASISWDYDTSDIVEAQRTPLPDGFEGMHHRQIVRYGRNWTVQSTLAATAVNAAFRQTEWRTATKNRAVDARNALDPPILDTSLAEAAGAEALANYLLDLHSVPRRMFTIDVSTAGWMPKLGHTTRVSYHRLGLAAGGVFRIVAAKLRLQESAASLLLWG